MASRPERAGPMVDQPPGRRALVPSSGDPAPARPVLRMVERTLVSVAVQEELRSYILEADLQPGSPLPSEGALARQLGVSRNSVREAVKALEGLGIVEVRVGSGIYVRAFSFDPILRNLPYGLRYELRSLTDVLEIRQILEVGMTDRIVDGLTDDRLDRLRDILAGWRRAADDGVYPAELDRLFHEGLQSASNPLVIRILDIFWEVFARASIAAPVPAPVDPVATLARHVAIFEPLARRDREGVREAIREHYRGIRDRLAAAELTAGADRT